MARPHPAYSGSELFNVYAMSLADGQGERLVEGVEPRTTREVSAMKILQVKHLNRSCSPPLTRF
ncbi:MAG: hypothetical protein QF515_00020 [Pseudomonadales bacterium]|jgi:hypothetical protein|nr:hypothetical protein [Pseudomonadales bacterium]|tara:strand:- start:765 stop:956 length:192 start_codon:yes stop_codon:yes gene_type:complete